MGLQKYRADTAGDKQGNGATPYYVNWIGGPTLALVRDCPIENKGIAPRTVYVRGEPDTYFSIPAACRYKGRTITGYIACDDKGQYVFRAHADQVI
jgi:hypothetical protein